jgi:hypothetical protein
MVCELTNRVPAEAVLKMIRNSSNENACTPMVLLNLVETMNVNTSEFDHVLTKPISKENVTEALSSVGIFD